MKAYKEVVKRVRDHDLWKHSYPESAKLSLLLRLVGPERFCARFLEEPSYRLRPVEEFIIELEEERRLKYITQTSYTLHSNKDGVPFAMCIADEYVSEVGHAIVEQANVEYALIISPRHQTASLRGKGNVNLSQLAKQCGGGGHPKAAGFPLSGGAKAMIKNMLGD